MTVFSSAKQVRFDKDEPCILITHGDNDGRGPAIILKTLGYNILGTFIVKNAPDTAAMLREIEGGVNVIITDLNVSLETCAELHRFKSVKIVDHHVTGAPVIKALDDLIAEGLDLQYYIDNSRCATYHVWKMTGSDEGLKNLAEWTDDRDRFLKQTLMSDRIFHLLAVLGDDYIPLVTELGIEQMLIQMADAVDERIAIEQMRVKENVNNALFSVVRGTRVAFIDRVRGYVSETGYFLTQQGYDLIIMVDRRNQKINIRGSDRIDCALLASFFGGGGHPKASGISNVPQDFLDNAYELITNRL